VAGRARRLRGADAFDRSLRLSGSIDLWGVGRRASSIATAHIIGGSSRKSSSSKERVMAAAVAAALVSTTNEIPGYRIVRPLGVVRGITVRSRSIVGNLGAALQTLVGGNITIYTELCEKARGEAFDLMLQHAAAMGANAVVGMRYDANEVAEGVTEVLAYGTAVQVEPGA
jgi:uncharacterized protein YbjQ (UPF0145 family)